MVDVKGIVNRYEAGLRRREAETEAALKEERTLREANAIAVGRCMRNVVAPVLRGVRGDLGAMGYTAHVDLIGREDPQLGKRRIAAAVRLTVPFIERSGPPKRSTLLFEGSFEEQMVTVEALAWRMTFLIASSMTL